MKILAVEEEQGLLDSIQDYLRKEAFVCEGVSTYQEGLRRITLNKYDCVLLDITNSDGDGMNLLKEIQFLPEIPNVIILSAKNSLDDKVKGLNMGADDYMVKPFHLSELNARIKAVARRNVVQEPVVYVVSNLNFHVESSRVIVDGHKLNFTKKEYDILFYLAQNQDRVVSKTAMVEHLWGDKIGREESFNFLFSHIKNIKRKLKKCTAGIYIRTVYGWGYQLKEISIDPAHSLL